MPRSRFDELVALAEDQDGLLTADQARKAGFTNSVLADSSNADGSNGQPAECIAFPIFRRAAFRSTGKLCSGQRRTEALATWPSRTLRLLLCTESQTPTRS